MTTPIAETFAMLRSAGKMAFMPFVTAGDPDLKTTAELIVELADRGVDLIEVGFPYSDPIADGPVIQASYTRALAQEIHVGDIFESVKKLTEDADRVTPPLVAMVSYAIVFRIGTQQFVNQAREAGFAGLIVPDLPVEEAGDLAQLIKAAGLDLIQLVAPTTTRRRALKILQTASGFLYCISVAGTTGVREQLPQQLNERLKWLKTQTDIPLAVGFGVSRPEQVTGLRGLADGVIVGSAIVRRISEAVEKNEPMAEALKGVGEFAATMASAAHGS